MTGGVAVPARIIRLAVLPFANLSGNPDQEYFSDGLTQELITQLGRLHPGGLEVIARTSVMRYKKRDTPIDQIGRELKLDYILQGSARLEGTAPGEARRVRIAAELIKVADQTQLWAEQYERELARILVLQSEVARKVAGALALTLLPAEQARLANARAVIPEVYEALPQGLPSTAEADASRSRHCGTVLRAGTREGPVLRGGLRGYRQSLGLRASRWASRLRAKPGARRRRRRAGQCPGVDNSADAHEALADVLTWTDWDWAGAEPEWRRALKLNPNDANTLRAYSHFLVITGRATRPCRTCERATRAGPVLRLDRGLNADDPHRHAAISTTRLPQPARRSRCSRTCQIGRSVTAAASHIKGMLDEALARQRRLQPRTPRRMEALERGLPKPATRARSGAS